MSSLHTAKRIATSYIHRPSWVRLLRMSSLHTAKRRDCICNISWLIGRLSGQEHRCTAATAPMHSDAGNTSTGTGPRGFVYQSMKLNTTEPAHQTLPRTSGQISLLLVRKLLVGSRTRWWVAVLRDVTSFIDISEERTAFILRAPQYTASHSRMQLSSWLSSGTSETSQNSACTEILFLNHLTTFLRM
jgi:hypothetical protein